MAKYSEALKEVRSRRDLANSDKKALPDKFENVEIGEIEVTPPVELKSDPKLEMPAKPAEEAGYNDDRKTFEHREGGVASGAQSGGGAMALASPRYTESAGSDSRKGSSGSPAGSESPAADSPSFGPGPGPILSPRPGDGPGPSEIGSATSPGSRPSSSESGGGALVKADEKSPAPAGDALHGEWLDDHHVSLRGTIDAGEGYNPTGPVNRFNGQVGHDDPRTNCS